MKHFKLMKGVLACLLSLALVLGCFSTTGINAAEKAADASATVAAPTAVAATYVPETDTLTTAGKVIYVLKNEKDNAIKSGAKCYTVSTKAEENTLTAIGAKATNKDVYLYVCDKEFEADGKVDANVIIKAQAANKIVGTIDYTQADIPDSTLVVTIKATDKAKKEIADVEAIWYDETLTTPVWAPINTFTGEKLVKLLEAGAKAVQVKMLGKASDKENIRTSKAVKVKLSKQGKAPKVSIDVSKDTISIKNGSDFALFTKSTSGESTVYNRVGEWHTVLPLLKDAETKTLDSSIVDTTSYAPVGKKDTNAKKGLTSGKVSYTSYKVKALGLDTYKKVLTTSGETTIDTAETEYYVGVRTSATEKKPASQVTYFKYSDKIEGPIIYTTDKVEGQYLVASGKEFTKKGFVLGTTIANYNGNDGTTGFDDSFALKTSNSGADTVSGNYEYTIVKLADLGDSSGSGCNIDWSSVSWKKLNAAKTKFNGKMKFKYLDKTGKKVEGTLSAGSISGEATQGLPSTGVSTVILVRRAGVKGKTAETAVLASDIKVLYVVKNGSDYEIYSTESVGDTAVKYTVEFYKWSKSGESTEYTWKKDDSLTITGWGREDSNSGEEIVAFPEAAKADFFKFTTDATSGEKVEAISTGTNKGKYVVDITGTSGEQTIKYAIREYANITVSGIGVTGNSGDEVTGSDVTIAKVIDGKVATSTSGAWTVSGSGEVTVYVGDTTALTVNEYTVPEGYVAANGGTRTVKAGEGYAIANTSGWTGSNPVKLSVTINTSDAVTVKVASPIVKTYTVTFDLAARKPEGADISSLTAPTAQTTDALGKITAPTGSFEVTVGEDTEAKTYQVTGWSLSTDGGAITDWNAPSFSANSTVYAIWAEKN